MTKAPLQLFNKRNRSLTSHTSDALRNAGDWERFGIKLKNKMALNIELE